MLRRARKTYPAARCCWVCGGLGGVGCTSALAAAGYEVPRDADGQFTIIAYAHPGCLALACRRASKRDLHKSKPAPILKPHAGGST